MKLGAAIAEIMKREGIQILTGYPVNHLIEYAADADIRPIMVRQERIGLHMADAISRVTSGRTIGAFCMQHGPGAENAYGGVAQCYGESVPVLVLPMGYPRRIAHIDPNFNSSVQMRGITKSAEPIMSAAEVPNILRRAFARLRNGRGGPVLVEIPTDMWNEEVPEPLAYHPVAATRYGPDPVDLERAAAMLAKAKRPVIYAGTGVHWARAWPQLQALAEMLAAPVTTSLGGKSAFPRRGVRHFLDNADVILGIGCSFTETNFGVKMPSGKKIIHATLDPDHLGKDIPIDIGLVGDETSEVDTETEEAGDERQQVGFVPTADGGILARRQSGENADRREGTEELPVVRPLKRFEVEAAQESHGGAPDDESIPPEASLLDVLQPVACDEPQVSQPPNERDKQAATADDVDGEAVARCKFRRVALGGVAFVDPHKEPCQTVEPCAVHVEDDECLPRDLVRDYPVHPKQ